MSRTFLSTVKLSIPNHLETVTWAKNPEFGLAWFFVCLVLKCHMLLHVIFRKILKFWWTKFLLVRSFKVQNSAFHSRFHSFDFRPHSRLQHYISYPNFQRSALLWQSYFQYPIPGCRPFQHCKSSSLLPYPTPNLWGLRDLAPSIFRCFRDQDQN